MGFMQSLRGFGPFVTGALLTAAIGIPAVGIGLVVWDWGFREPEVTGWEATEIKYIDLCPGIRDARTDRFIEAAKQWYEHTPLNVPLLEEVEICSWPPKQHHLQVRDCNDTDVPAPYNAGCPEGHFDNVGIDRGNHIGIAYISKKPEPNLEEHLIGHVLGFEDNLRGASVMNHKAPFGDSFDGLVIP